jgi:hypothetical protein
VCWFLLDWNIGHPNSLNEACLSKDLITELCQFAGTSIHPVVAFIDGVTF